METIVSLGPEHHILPSCNVNTCMVIICIVCLNTFINVLEHYMLLSDQTSSCVIYHTLFTGRVLYYIQYFFFNFYRLIRYRCNKSKESNQMWILFTGRFIRKAYLLCRKKSLLQWMHLNLWLEFVFKRLRMLSTGCSSHWVALTG